MASQWTTREAMKTLSEHISWLESLTGDGIISSNLVVGRNEAA